MRYEILLDVEEKTGTRPGRGSNFRAQATVTDEHGGVSSVEVYAGSESTAARAALRAAWTLIDTTGISDADEST